MTKNTNPHRLAGTAIAAFLALSSTSLWAQEVAAPADAPVSAPVAPTIVLPPVVLQAAPAPVIETAPVIADAPAPRVEAAKPAAPRASTTTRPLAGRAVPAVAAPIAREVTGPVEEIVPITPVAETDTLPADLAGPTVATAEPASTDDSNELLLAGLAGALGLGAIGLFVATRRRRPVEAADTVAEYESESITAEPVGETPQRYATLAAPAFTPLAAWSEPRVSHAQPTDYRALNLNRSALIGRMVAAEPDANNPFTSGKARRRRARIMLQSLDNQRWEDAELAPGFDWREMAQATHERETVPA